VSKDTTTVSFGDIIVRITNTSTCFPSSEVFSFTAVGPALPAGAFYQWQFGDGNTAKGSTVNYSYQAAGSFLVNLFLMQDENTVIS
ncbi:PKD domain-containing protein, partial [Acinetobacter baumannii]